MHVYQNSAVTLASLSYRTTSKYCYPCYISHPTNSKCYKPSICNFFGLAISLSFFFVFLFLFSEIGRIYGWIIITIVSNIAVLVSQNVIFFGYLTPNSHGVNKKTSPGASLNLLPLIAGFHNVCLLFYKK